MELDFNLLSRDGRKYESKGSAEYPRLINSSVIAIQLAMTAVPD